MTDPFRAVPAGVPGRRLLPCGDEAVLVECADLADARAVLAALERTGPAPAGGGPVAEVVPGARTLLLRLRTGIDDPAVAALTARLLTAPATPDDAGGPGRGAAPTAVGAPVEIPVRYDGEDLAAVAALLGVDPAEVVRRHTGTVWTVAFGGFAPGFGYLVPQTSGGHLTVPRRDSPRTAVPAGAVGLAGSYSGVYPRSGPGGWQLIGRTDLVLFDPDADPPALLRPGARVRFTDLGAAR
ncbi:allophanate hydrolase subunit 1 [Friedmanniella endophytica]|uniref:Allophanate hydrolase subunit 1 n=1 Tax=Microlunatus kandeliicorticis TaxID=1759536 RepID=A0A7W3P4Y4_9ACTN|nr:allophanate hydrolase subunit 1 [Microlunatus kandeliicorticis]MBA8793320.1 allophanate hydrolase subunit 1 [Microlunatus kandeliicorticis]